MPRARNARAVAEPANEPQGNDQQAADVQPGNGQLALAGAPQQRQERGDFEQAQAVVHDARQAHARGAPEALAMIAAFQNIAIAGMVVGTAIYVYSNELAFREREQLHQHEIQRDNQKTIAYLIRNTSDGAKRLADNGINIFQVIAEQIQSHPGEPSWLSQSMSVLKLAMLSFLTTQFVKMCVQWGVKPAYWFAQNAFRKWLRKQNNEQNRTPPPEPQQPEPRGPAQVPGKQVRMPPSFVLPRR